TFGGVDEQHRHVGAFDCPNGAHDAELLNARLHPPAAPDAGRIDQQNCLTVTHDLTVDGITRRPGVVADDRAWAADQAVDQARLADVGSTDNSDRHGWGDLFDRR